MSFRVSQTVQLHQLMLLTLACILACCSSGPSFGEKQHRWTPRFELGGRGTITL
jgi:hypothetical protein